MPLNTPRSGTLLCVSETTAEQTAMLSSVFDVIDTGIGIKDEDLDKLFESFKRIEEKRNRHIEGTGLGISIVCKLLAMMDSKLDVESKYAIGSTFGFDSEAPRSLILSPSEITKRRKEQAV